MRPARRTVVCFVAASVVLGGGTAAAQSQEPSKTSFAAQEQAPPPAPPSEPTWDIEIHGGWSANGHPSRGSGSLPSTGASVGGWISASSFYFGTGAKLFNQNQVAISGSQTPPMIAPLDQILLGSAVRRPRLAGTLGVRVGRSFGRRLAAEVTADYGPSDLTFTNAALTGIEATRASYVPALTRALSSATSSAASITTFHPQQARQIFTIGSALINLRTSGKARPYAAVGAGVVFNTGDAPSATLAGTYQLGNPAQIFGSDIVDLTYSVRQWTVVAAGGGGLKYSLTRRWGLRFDARAYVYRNTIDNRVSTSPTIALESTGSPFPLVNSGALQFSSTDPMNGVPVNAVGGTVIGSAGVPGFRTFAGSGLQTHVSITAGLSWRF